MDLNTIDTICCQSMFVQEHVDTVTCTYTGIGTRQVRFRPFQLICTILYSSSQFSLFTLPDISSISGNLAESCYLLRRDLFPWLTQNILWHIFSTWSCGRGGQRGLTAKQVPGGVRVPRDLLSLPLRFINIFPLLSPLSSAIYRWLRAPASGNMVNRGGRI